MGKQNKAREVWSVKLNADNLLPFTVIQRLKYTNLYQESHNKTCSRAASDYYQFLIYVVKIQIICDDSIFVVVCYDVTRLCKTTRRDFYTDYASHSTAHPFHLFILMPTVGANKDQNKLFLSYATASWKQVINIHIATVCDCNWQKTTPSCVYVWACAFVNILQMYCIYFEGVLDASVACVNVSAFDLHLAVCAHLKGKKSQCAMCCSTRVCDKICVLMQFKCVCVSVPLNDYALSNMHDMHLNVIFRWRWC